MSGADSETTPAASLDVRPRQQTTKRGAGFTVTPLIRTREGANKQVISSQADSLIKISRIWADYFSHQQLESACLGRFFAISGVIPGF
jgi:hypothetical protein